MTCRRFTRSTITSKNNSRCYTALGPLERSESSPYYRAGLPESLRGSRGLSGTQCSTAGLGAIRIYAWPAWPREPGGLWGEVLRGRVSRELLFWGVVYELVYLVVSVAVGFALYESSRASPVESVLFVREHGALYAVTSIWLVNTGSFFLGATLAVLHPALGALAVAFSSASMGELLASWLAGYCGGAHLAYAVAESQAYILLWLSAVETYYLQLGCGDLLCRWDSTLRSTARLATYAFTVFLALAVVEVAEVRLLG